MKPLIPNGQMMPISNEIKYDCDCDVNIIPSESDTVTYYHEPTKNCGNYVYDFIYDLNMFFKTPIQNPLYSMITFGGYTWYYLTSNKQLGDFINMIKIYFETYGNLMKYINNDNLNEFNNAKKALYSKLCDLIQNYSDNEIYKFFGFNEPTESQKNIINILKSIKEILEKKYCESDSSTCSDKNKCGCEPRCENNILYLLSQIAQLFNLTNLVCTYSIIINNNEYIMKIDYNYSSDNTITISNAGLFSLGFSLTNSGFSPNPLNGKFSNNSFSFYVSDNNGQNVKLYILTFNGLNKTLTLTGNGILVFPNKKSTTQIINTPYSSTITSGNITTTYVGDIEIINVNPTFNSFVNNNVLYSMMSSIELPNIININAGDVNPDRDFILGTLSKNFYYAYINFILNPCDVTGVAYGQLQDAISALQYLLTTEFGVGTEKYNLLINLLSGTPVGQISLLAGGKSITTFTNLLGQLTASINACVGCNRCGSCCNNDCEVNILNKFCDLCEKFSEIVDDKNVGSASQTINSVNSPWSISSYLEYNQDMIIPENSSVYPGLSPSSLLLQMEFISSKPENNATGELDYVPIGHCDITSTTDDTGLTHYNSSICYLPNIIVTSNNSTGTCNTSITLCIGILSQIFYNKYIELKITKCGTNYVNLLENMKNALNDLNELICSLFDPCTIVGSVYKQDLFNIFIPDIDKILHELCDLIKKCSIDCNYCSQINDISQFIIEMIMMINTQDCKSCPVSKYPDNPCNKCINNVNNNSYIPDCNCNSTNHSHNSNNPCNVYDSPNSSVIEACNKYKDKMIDLFLCNPQLNKCTDPRVLFIYMFRGFVQELITTSICTEQKITGQNGLEHKLCNVERHICKLEKTDQEIKGVICDICADIKQVNENIDDITDDIKEITDEICDLKQNSCKHNKNNCVTNSSNSNVSNNDCDPCNDVKKNLNQYNTRNYKDIQTYKYNRKCRQDTSSSSSSSSSVCHQYKYKNNDCNDCDNKEDYEKRIEYLEKQIYNLIKDKNNNKC